MASRYQDLVVWQKSVELVSLVYKLTEDFPSEEKFSLTRQIRRCVVSIPSNIAEGAQQSTTQSFIHFLSIALGSCAELETQLIVAKNLGLVKDERLYKECMTRAEEVGKMLVGLMHALEQKSSPKKIPDKPRSKLLATRN